MNRSPLPSRSCPVIILAGGKSSRFGTSKALARLGTRTLIEHVYDTVAAQTSAPVLLNAAQEFDAPIQAERVEDQMSSGLGPLAGLHAALSWAAEHKAPEIATVPVDTPFLPDTLLAQLEQSGAPSFAQSRGRNHPTIGLWPASLLAPLTAAIENGMRTAGAWLEACNAKGVTFADEGELDPFFNINTQDDFAIAARLVDRRS